MTVEPPSPPPRRFRAWLTPPRLNFYFAGMLFAQLGLFLALETAGGTLDRQGRVRGRDYLQFYVTGRIVACGEADRLYDQDHVLELQEAVTPVDDQCPRYFSTYPPLVPLLFSPLSRLPYPAAIAVWWLIQALCFAAAGVVLYRTLDPPPDWRSTVGLGLAAFFPVFNTVLNGQLAAVLLLVFVVGLELHRRGRPVVAGGVLALLAVKPQLAAGVVVWLVVRRDVRAAAGFALGLLAEAGVVWALLPAQAWPDYLATTRQYMELFRHHRISPDHQHALAGILLNAFGAEFSIWSMRLHLLLAAVGGLLLIRIVWRSTDARLEEAAAVVFTVLATPHLLTYDLVYLLIPVAYLLAISRMGEEVGPTGPAVLLYLGAMFAPLYGLLGFSLVPAILVAALCLIARGMPAKNGARPRETPAGALP